MWPLKDAVVQLEVLNEGDCLKLTLRELDPQGPGPEDVHTGVASGRSTSR